MSKNTVLVLILAFGLGVVLCIAGNSDAAEPSGEIYQWTLPNGDVSMTDDAKRIPAKYKSIAVKRSLAQVGKDANFTEVVVPSDQHKQEIEDRLRHLRKAAARNATSLRVEGCDGPITVAQERRDYEERGNSYNSLFYIIHDSCGNEVSVTRTNPRPFFGVE